MSTQSRRLVFETYCEIDKCNRIYENNECGSDSVSCALERLTEQVLSPKCKIAVVGEFKRGKTSFLNALLGEKILPEAVSPWTAVPTEIVFAEKEIAYVWTETELKQVDDRASLEGWLTKSKVQTEKARKARIGYPSMFLFDNEVTLWDTPGLNDNDGLDARVIDTVRDADILIWMLSNSSPFSLTELNYLTVLIQNSTVSQVIFLVNKIDVVEEEDREVLIQTVTKRIRTLVEDTPAKKICFYGNSIPVFGVSTKYAVEAWEENDQELLRESGFPILYGKLEEVIGFVRWKKQTAVVLRALAQQINQEISLCDQKIEEWSERENKLETGLQELSALEDYFKGAIVKRMVSVGCDLKREICSSLVLLQSKFDSNIYSRGYGVLNACCEDANAWMISYRNSIFSAVEAQMKGLCDSGKEEFEFRFSEICRKAEFENPMDGQIKENFTLPERYFRTESFWTLDFPKLLFMRDYSAREEYIDDVVRGNLYRFADGCKNDCNIMAMAAEKEQNDSSNRVLRKTSDAMEKARDDCKEKSRQIAESSFYRQLNEMWWETMELAASTEEVLF